MLRLQNQKVENAHISSYFKSCVQQPYDSAFSYIILILAFFPIQVIEWLLNLLAGFFNGSAMFSISYGRTVVDTRTWIKGAEEKQFSLVTMAAGCCCRE